MRLIFTIVLIFIMFNNWGVVEGKYIKSVNDLCDRQTKNYLNKYNNSICLDVEIYKNNCIKKYVKDLKIFIKIFTWIFISILTWFYIIIFTTFTLLFI